jgi:acetamidase/formamidase
MRNFDVELTPAATEAITRIVAFINEAVAELPGDEALMASLAVQAIIASEGIGLIAAARAAADNRLAGETATA